MLRRFIAIIAAALMLQGTAWAALPNAPVPTTNVTVTGALLDQITRTSTNPQAGKTQGIANYTVAFHDDRFQYAMPLCFEPSLVEVDGRTVDPAAFVVGDTLTISIRPNAATPAKVCAFRIVRQKISRGSSGGECLQDFQVKHEIEGAPKRLLIKTDYVVLFSIYNRPTLECDGKAYGSAPITTTVAAGKPFELTLSRETASGLREVKRWSLTTDNSGRANINYTFTLPADKYQFKLKPGTVGAPGDELSWDVQVFDPNPSPSPAAAANSNPKSLTTTPIIIVLVVILLLAAIAEYWRWVKKQRASESPEQEYNRVSKL